MLKINDFLNAVKEERKDLNVLIENDTYFTVENEEGYRAYVQADRNPFFGWMFTTVHKPNRNSGGGRQEYSEVHPQDLKSAFSFLDRTLEKSKMLIQSGKEQKDTRKPHESRKFFNS